MSHTLPHHKNRWAFITALVFWILFLVLFVLSLAVVVPQIAVGYGTQPGNFGPDGEFTMFAAWMFGLGPAGILTVITSLVSSLHQSAKTILGIHACHRLFWRSAFQCC